jgi:hypothetical protein
VNYVTYYQNCVTIRGIERHIFERVIIYSDNQNFDIINLQSCGKLIYVIGVMLIMARATGFIENSTGGKIHIFLILIFIAFIIRLIQNKRVIKFINYQKSNKMKKVVLSLILAFLSLTFLPLQSKAVTTEEPTSVPAPKPAENAEAKALELRLNEINAMDKTKMKSEEKKDLRKEVKSIKHNLRTIGSGVYLSGAAIILIVILLIILL